MSKQSRARSLGSETIAGDYHTILEAYAFRDDESALQRAYEFGKTLVEQDQSILSLLECHHTSLEDMLVRNPEKSARILKRGGALLAEIMQRFEASYSHAHTLNAQIQESNQDLKHAQDRLIEIMDFAPVGLYLINAEGECTFVNKRWCEITGLEPHDALGVGWANSIHRDDIEKVLLGWSKALYTREAFSLEYRIRRPSQHDRWVIGHAVALTDDASGELRAFLGSVQDVTELRDSQRRAEQAEILGRLGRWEYNPEFRQFTCSKGLSVLVEHDDVESPLQLESMRDLIHPDDAAQVAANLNELLSRPSGSIQQDFRLMLPHNRIKWIHEVLALVLDELTGSRNLMGKWLDVTDTTLAEKEARIYKSALDQSAIVAMTDPRGRIIYTNEAFTKISGYSKEELIGQDHRLLNSGLMGKSFFREMWRSIASGKTWRGEICNRTKNGELYWVDTTIVPHLDSTGKPDLFTAIRYEITERKKIERELSATNDLQKAILESAKVGVIATDENGLIHTFNSMAAEILGYTPDEVLHKMNAFGFHDEEELQKYCEEARREGHVGIQTGGDLFRSVARGDIAGFDEWHYVRKDGTRFPVRLSLTEIRDKSGHRVGYLGIFEDITENKRIREELIEANRIALAAVKARSEFFAKMSHEIRTPMNGVIGMCSLLLGSVKEPEHMERLKIIQKSGNALLEIINDILDFSKLEADRVEIENKPLSLVQVANEVIDLLSQLASDKGLKLSLERDDPRVDWILGDAAHLRQILTNLVSNSLKFTQKGSVRVTIATRKTSKGALELTISVKDTGIGIPKELQTRLFHAFTQADASTFKEFGGTGLGLVICRGLVERMGGRIWLESEVGVGTSFFFTIYTQECEAQETNSKASDPFLEIDPNMGSKYPKRILIVEDNRVNHAVLLGLLRKFGYEADWAGNGLEAVQKVKEQSFDLILMDCQMPEMDGYDATRNILAMYPSTKRPRIVALTASTTREDMERCRQSGMDDFVSKPITIPALARILMEAKHHPGPTGQSEVLPTPEPCGPSHPCFDARKFWEKFQGMEQVGMDAIRLFLAELPGMIDGLRDAVERLDFRDIEIKAHTLKGVVANFPAEPTLILVQKLEKMGQLKQSLQLDQTLQELKSDLAKLAEALQTMLNERKVA